jgi:hypothetical protein
MSSTPPQVTRYPISRRPLRRLLRYARETYLARPHPKRLGRCARMLALTRKAW